MALFSSKGYAVGEKFAQWLAAELHVKKDTMEGELLGYTQDLLAICGSRSYVFFLNAAIVDRFAQTGSLITYLEQESDMGSENGGKLRNAILIGYKSDEIRAAVHAMAFICEACVWPALHAIKCNLDQHILDVLPSFWSNFVEFFERAAASPASVMNGDLAMKLPFDTSRDTHTPRSARAALDMERIRRATEGNALVERMLTAAFNAMVAGAKNHAAEFLPGGKLALGSFSEADRIRLSGCPTTSTAAERLFAVGRAHDSRKGVTRADHRSGYVLGKLDKTTEWALRREPTTLRLELKACKRMSRMLNHSGQLEEVRRISGMFKRDDREEKLAAVRAKRESKAAERRRLEELVLKKYYSELRLLGIEDLKDQLRAWKLKLGDKANFTVTHANRAGYVLQVQALMAAEYGKDANDLPPGDAGTDGRGVMRKRAETGGGAGGRKRKRPGIIEYDGWEWDEGEEFELEAIVDKQVACGQRSFANLGKVRKGVIVYRLVFKGFPPDMEWWEPRSSVGTAALDEYEAALASEQAQREAEEAEEAELRSWEVELEQELNACASPSPSESERT